LLIISWLAAIPAFAQALSNAPNAVCTFEENKAFEYRRIPSAEFIPKFIQGVEGGSDEGAFHLLTNFGEADAESIS
jgi:hypothetical protein